MRRYVAAAMFLLGAASARGDPPVAGHIETAALRQVGDGLYVIEDRDYVPAVPNVGLVVGASGVLVIDPGIDEVEARKVLDIVERVAPARRIYVTSTHFHPEHAFGLAVFKGRATIIANAAQVSEMKRKGRAYVALFTRLGMDSLVRSTRFIEPDIVYRERYRLDLGNKSIDLSSGHAGHTLGDQIVFVPDLRAVFLGDLLETNSFPILPWYPDMKDTDVSPRRWMETLNWALALQPDIVVPGHGPVAGPAAIKSLLDYMEAEQAQVVEACPTAKDVSSLRSVLTPRLLALQPNWHLTEWAPESVEPFAKDFCPRLLGLPARQQIERYETSGAAPSTILEGALLPAGAEVLLLSGQTATLADAPEKPVGPNVTAAQLGDTQQQTANILARLKRTLESRGWGISDVVRLTVFLVGDPAKGGRMDYTGMNKAYAQFFGTSANRNLVTRATVQVVALAQPAFLVEVEATAARVPKRP